MNARILVVDDDPRVRAALRAELASVGCRPTAVSPNRLRQGERLGDLDLALVDVSPPSTARGLTVITRLAALLPVVALSIDGALKDAALHAGAAHYLEKDGDADHLLRVLRTTMQHTSEPQTKEPR